MKKHVLKIILGAIAIGSFSFLAGCTQASAMGINMDGSTTVPSTGSATYVVPITFELTNSSGDCPQCVGIFRYQTSYYPMVWNSYAGIIYGFQNQGQIVATLQQSTTIWVAKGLYMGFQAQVGFSNDSEQLSCTITATNGISLLNTSNATALANQPLIITEDCN